MYILMRQQWIACPQDQVFEFFSDARNLEAITPPWLKFRILSPAPVPMVQRAQIEYQLSWRFVKLRWVTLITHWSPPHFFVDLQQSGPYRYWEHTHAFRDENGGTRMFDTVRYELPLGILGRMAHSLKVRCDLERIFDYRAAKITEYFDREQARQHSLGR
jgi:ligand-binding SRPBCC domain-containing protein